MRFIQTATDENFQGSRWLSESGRWELGHQPMLFGVRVSLGQVGDGGVIIDYCAGASPLIQSLLFRMMVLILEGVQENCTPDELCAFFPSYQRRPINLDPTCWNTLSELAARSA